MEATRPLPSFGLLACSVGNESVSCRSSANQAKRQLFILANSHSVPNAAIRSLRASMTGFRCHRSSERLPNLIAAYPVVSPANDPATDTVRTVVPPRPLHPLPVSSGSAYWPGHRSRCATIPVLRAPGDSPSGARSPLSAIVRTGIVHVARAAGYPPCIFRFMAFRSLEEGVN